MKSLEVEYKPTTVQKYVSACMRFFSFVSKSWHSNFDDHTKNNIKNAFSEIVDYTSFYREGLSKSCTEQKNQQKLELTKNPEACDVESIFDHENFKRFEQEINDKIQSGKRLLTAEKRKVCRTAMASLLVQYQRPSVVENLTIEEFNTRSKNNVIFVGKHKTQAYSPGVIVLDENSLHWIDIYLKYVRPERLMKINV